MHNAASLARPDAMTDLEKLLDAYREAADSEREKGTYFEELIVC